MRLNTLREFMLFNEDDIDSYSFDEYRISKKTKMSHLKRLRRPNLFSKSTKIYNTFSERIKQAQCRTDSNRYGNCISSCKNDTEQYIKMSDFNSSEICYIINTRATDRLIRQIMDWMKRENCTDYPDFYKSFKELREIYSTAYYDSITQEYYLVRRDQSDYICLQKV